MRIDLRIKMVKIHYFGTKINDFHKDWNDFQVECGRLIRRDLVTDNINKVTCESCLKLQKMRID